MDRCECCSRKIKDSKVCAKCEKYVWLALEEAVLQYLNTKNKGVRETVVKGIYRYDWADGDILVKVIYKCNSFNITSAFSADQDTFQHLINRDIEGWEKITEAQAIKILGYNPVVNRSRVER